MKPLAEAPPPTDADKHAAAVFLSAVNEVRERHGLRPVATKGRARSVRKALDAYFALGLPLKRALRALADAQGRVPVDHELLYPTRLAKLTYLDMLAEAEALDEGLPLGWESVEPVV